eukprot:11006576-Alexandrium_andersonii.AAC.1
MERFGAVWSGFLRASPPCNVLGRAPAPHPRNPPKSASSARTESLFRVGPGGMGAPSRRARGAGIRVL